MRLELGPPGEAIGALAAPALAIGAAAVLAVGWGRWRSWVAAS